MAPAGAVWGLAIQRTQTPSPPRGRPRQHLATMKLYVSYNPRAAVLAKDENQARVLLRARLLERGIRCKRPKLTEVSQSAARVLLPPPKEDYATEPRRPRGGVQPQRQDR